MVKRRNYFTKVNFTNVNIPIKWIVIHDTGVVGQTAQNNADYFYDKDRGASANDFVDKNEIVSVVPDGKKAWHVGDDKPGDRFDVGDLINNSNSIGIELCGEKDYSIHPNTLANAAWLVQYYMKKYNVPASHVVRHYDASGKNCPQLMNRDGKWTLWFKNHKILTGQAGSVSTPTIPTGNKVTSIKVAKGDTLWGISKQYNVTVEQLKAYNGLKSDTLQIGQVLKLMKTTVPTTTKKVATPTVKFYLPTGVYTRKTHGGSKSDDVLNIQKGLSAVYFYPAKGEKNNGCDGWFGGDTENALERFQSFYGLTVDGKYGPQVRNKLNQLLN